MPKRPLYVQLGYPRGRGRGEDRDVAVRREKQRVKKAHERASLRRSLSFDLKLDVANLAWAVHSAERLTIDQLQRLTRWRGVRGKKVVGGNLARRDTCCLVRKLRLGQLLRMQK